MMSIKERNNIIMEHYDLIQVIAQRFIKSGVPQEEYEDLVQEGAIGLMQAIDRFDPSRGVKLKTFCEWRIKGSMLDHLRHIDPLPKSIRNVIKKRAKLIDKFVEKYCKSPSDVEMADFLEMSLEDYIKQYCTFPDYEFLSLDNVYRSEQNEVNNFSLYEIIADESKQFIDRLREESDFDFLVDKIYTMNHNKRTAKGKHVMILYFLEGMSMREVGEALSITESRVSQIVTDMVKRLKKEYKKEMSESVYA